MNAYSTQINMFKWFEKGVRCSFTEKTIYCIVDVYCVVDLFMEIPLEPCFTCKEEKHMTNLWQRLFSTDAAVILAVSSVTI